MTIYNYFLMYHKLCVQTQYIMGNPEWCVECYLNGYHMQIHVVTSYLALNSWNAWVTYENTEGLLIQGHIIWMILTSTDCNGRISVPVIIHMRELCSTFNYTNGASATPSHRNVMQRINRRNSYRLRFNKMPTVRVGSKGIFRNAEKSHNMLNKFKHLITVTALLCRYTSDTPSHTQKSYMLQLKTIIETAWKRKCSSHTVVWQQQCHRSGSRGVGRIICSGGSRVCRKISRIC